MGSMMNDLGYVDKVRIEECVERWDVRGEAEAGWAYVVREFKKDRQDAARLLACNWCRKLGLAEYTITTFTSEKYSFHEEVIQAETGQVISTRDYKVE